MNKIKFLGPFAYLLLQLHQDSLFGLSNITFYFCSQKCILPRESILSQQFEPLGNWEIY